MWHLRTMMVVGLAMLVLGADLSRASMTLFLNPIDFTNQLGFAPSTTTIPVPTFDPTLGKLTGVTFSVDENFQTALNVADFVLGTPAGAITNILVSTNAGLVGPNLSSAATLTAAQPFLAYPASLFSFSSAVFSHEATRSAGTISGSGVTPYVGDGSSTVSLTYSTSPPVVSSDPLPPHVFMAALVSGTTVTGRLTVAYTYDLMHPDIVLPEPATAGLAVVGAVSMVVLGLARSRRTR